MSLAWATIALLVVLLPGFLFFLGTYIPERFSRVLADRSPLSQLAGTVFISFLVHSILFLVLRYTCNALDIFGLNPCIDLETVFAVFQLEGSERTVSTTELARRLHESSESILIYTLMASLWGLTLGYFFGVAIIRNWSLPLFRFRFQFRSFAKHDWVYRILTGKTEYTVACVLSKVFNAERFVVYRGFLVSFGLNHEGTFSYLYLSGPKRSYLRLKYQGAEVQTPFHEIGEAGLGWDGNDSLVERYFMIDGKDISNTVFENFSYSPVKKEEVKRLERAEGIKVLGPPPPSKETPKRGAIDTSSVSS